MLIDATHPEETRVVVLRGNRVEEFDFETAHRKQLRGNIYLAKVTRVEPSLQAAFVEYGGNRQGFLAFSEIHPDYYQIPVADRQALLAEEERAEREEEEHEQRGGEQDRQPAMHRHARRDEAARGENLISEEMAREAAEIPAGENVLGDLPAEITRKDAAPPLAAAGEYADESAVDHLSAEEQSREAAEMPAGEAEIEAPPAEAAPSGEVPAPAAPQEHQESNGDNGRGESGEDEAVESVGGTDVMEEVPERRRRYRRPYKIQEVIKRRQIMLVQVVKEERGSKGAALTTYLSLAGRYCVLMPNTARGGGISRKITNPEDRRRLREIASELQVPEGMGVILRTAGANRNKSEIKRDFEYLLRQWETVRELTLQSTAPTLVYEEGSLIKRALRDLYNKDIDEVIVAGEEGYREAIEFMSMLMPSHVKNVHLYRDREPIFTRYGVASQLDAMFSPVVHLKSGGYIVLNQTEALVSIDVNSGRATREHHIEDTALKTNLEAAEEIARQLRLRDLAGLIVIDFIDMAERRNNRTVERALKEALKHDRARIQVGRISPFGLLEMSRQRIRASVLESSTEQCPHCGGTGHVRSVSSMALQLLRSLEETLLKGATHNLIARTRPEVALYVLNQKRAHLRDLEERFHLTITINADPQMGGQTYFVVDRAEQVRSPEQAKALLAQEAQVAPPIPAEAVAAAAPSAEMQEAAGDLGAPEEMVGAPAAPLEGERESGRRRRRRRRRGRGGEGRSESHSEERESFTHETAAEHVIAHEEDHEPFPEAAPPPAAFSPTSPQGGSEPRGEGERRRRRRGHRGGRRRRDREMAPDFADETLRGSPEVAEHPSPPFHDVVEPPPTVAPESPPAVVAPAPPTPATEPAPPRRRSTVREPAPAFGQETAAPPPPPPPAAVSVVSSSSDSEEEKPRRTGWWARRLLGDKG